MVILWETWWTVFLFWELTCPVMTLLIVFKFEQGLWRAGLPFFVRDCDSDIAPCEFVEVQSSLPDSCSQVFSECGVGLLFQRQLWSFRLCQSSNLRCLRLVRWKFVGENLRCLRPLVEICRWNLAMAEVEIGNMLGMHTAQEAYKEIVQNLWKNAPWLTNERGTIRTGRDSFVRMRTWLSGSPQIGRNPLFCHYFRIGFSLSASYPSVN